MFAKSKVGKYLSPARLKGIQGSQKEYSYILTYSDTGDRQLTGPFSTDLEAQRKADTLSVPYEIISYPTRNLTKALALANQGVQNAEVGYRSG